MATEQAHWWLSNFWLSVFPKYFFWINAIVCTALICLLFLERKRYDAKIATLQKEIDEDSVLQFAKSSKTPETIEIVNHLDKRLRQHGVSLRKDKEH